MIKQKSGWKVIILLITGLFLLESLILAEEKEEEDKEKSLDYSSETSLALALVRGNNQNFSLSFDTEQELKIKKLNKIEYKGKFIKANSNITF